jgi:phage shock protein PspC (stress-responsive transcriptional regulator)
MALSDELAKLHELHQRGALTDDEFARAKAGVIAGPAAPDGSNPESALLTRLNALRRSRGERWVAGVCGGIAHATGVAPWLWRLLFALFLLCGGMGLLLYLLLWIFVPSE